MNVRPESGRTPSGVTPLPPARPPDPLLHHSCTENSLRDMSASAGT